MGVASSIVLSTLANMKGELSVDCTAAGRCFYTLRVFKPRLKVKGVPFCHCDLPSSSYIKHVLHSCTEDSLYYPWQLPAPLVPPLYDVTSPPLRLSGLLSVTPISLGSRALVSNYIVAAPISSHLHLVTSMQPDAEHSFTLRMEDVLIY